MFCFEYFAGSPMILVRARGDQTGLCSAHLLAVSLHDIFCQSSWLECCRDIMQQVRNKSTCRRYPVRRTLCGPRQNTDLSVQPSPIRTCSLTFFRFLLAVLAYANFFLKLVAISVFEAGRAVWLQNSVTVASAILGMSLARCGVIF